MNSDKKSEKPKEQEAVFTTIVGGRPPGSGTQVGNIPRGIEVLVKKASVDPEFRELLLEKRAEAAKEIDLKLDKTEADMLAAIPREQLEKIIDNTKVPVDQKPVFQSNFGKIMLWTVVTGTVVAILTGITPPKTFGHTLTPEEMERIEQMHLKYLADSNDVNDTASGKLEPNIPQNYIAPPVSRGISADRIDK